MRTDLGWQDGTCELEISPHIHPKRLGRRSFQGGNAASFDASGSRTGADDGDADDQVYHLVPLKV